jgi:hypothetical protein
MFLFLGRLGPAFPVVQELMDGLLADAHAPGDLGERVPRLPQPGRLPPRLDVPRSPRARPLRGARVEPFPADEPIERVAARQPARSRTANSVAPNREASSAATRVRASWRRSSWAAVAMAWASWRASASFSGGSGSGRASSRTGKVDCSAKRPAPPLGTIIRQLARCPHKESKASRIHLTCPLPACTKKN